MTQRFFSARRFPAAAISILLALAGFITSCSTTPPPTAGNSAFKFWVLRYKPPVDAASWVSNAALSADPEGAALNIATAMRQGNLEEWLACWPASERPALTPAQTETMRREWQSLAGAHFSILGRVVAEGDIIVELSVEEPAGSAGKIQIPLKHQNDRWWLTAMDPASEYLHWENSPNKLIDYIDPDAFQKHLKMIQGSKSQSKAETPEKSGSVAGL